MSRFLKILISIITILFTPLLVVYFWRLMNGVEAPFRILDLLTYFSTKNFFLTTKEQFTIIEVCLNKFGELAFNTNPDIVGSLTLPNWLEFAQPVADAIQVGANWLLGALIGVKDVLVAVYELIISVATIAWTFLVDLVDIIGWLFGIFEYSLII